MTMSSADKGGRELAAAWLRRADADRQINGGKGRTSAGGDVRRPAAKPETAAIFHSETQVGFFRA